MLAMHHDLIMMKKKRSKRPRSASPLALTIATSSSTTDLSIGAAGDGVISDVSPSNSNSGDLAHSAAADDEEEDMANCLILLARGQGERWSQQPPPAAELYQCKTCCKSFSSFQALGGHRASHKKPNKAAAAATNVEEKKPSPMMREKHESFLVRERDDGTNLSLQISSRSSLSKIRVHECSICGAEFGSGQALGGHMRRHRPIPAAAIGGGEEPQVAKKARNLLSLDLNLPAPEDEQPESKFPFSTKEQVIVFAASPLIDCHY